jgi:protein O-mannosyl-transferase
MRTGLESRAVPEGETLPRMVPRPRWRELAVAAALVLGVAFTYRAVPGFDFIQFDDGVYVTENPIVRDGLSRESAAIALTSFHTGNWIPLTWLSHMIDVEAFGLSAGGHHAVNAAWHAANAVLLFAVLRAATGALWPAAFVAAAFALHPTRVEAVAWVSQRKELLATALALCAIAAHLGWVRRARPAYRTAALGAYFLALAAKPIAVSLPFLLLLLDVWPLGRTALAAPAAAPPRAPGGPREIVREKLPFFALALISSVTMVAAQASEGAVRDLSRYPLGVRVATALVGYPAYLVSALWPSGLSVFYSHPHGFSAWKIAGGAALITAGCAAALVLVRRVPAVAVGWFWFLGWLVPVIGLVQIGGAWRADRYAYFAFVGLFVAVAWGAAALVARHPRARPLVAALAIALLAVWSLGSERQASYWRGTRPLFEHAIDVDPHNAMAHASLGAFAEREGRPADALTSYERALRLDPHFDMLRYDRGRLLLDLGRTDEARAELELAVQERPEHAAAHAALGRALEALGERDRAASEYRAALALDPDALSATAR